MGQYLGFVQLEDAVFLQAVFKDSDSPANTDSPPVYRVYGPDGLMPNGTGTLAKQDTGVVTGATNASPIVITSANHNLQTGVKVTTSGVGGNTAANTTATVTRIDADHFSLDGTTGNSGYTSGGVWNASGVYFASIDVNAANNYAQGVTYSVLVEGAISGTVKADTNTFTVV